MFQPSVSPAIDSPLYPTSRSDFVVADSPFWDDSNTPEIQETTTAHWLLRRWRRERRRRKVGRAYDMALEISRSLRRSPSQRILDVGCGNGYIAHHLSGMLRANVMGIDLAARTEAAIDYRPFDGSRFPVETNSLDAVLFCYVMHHAQDLDSLLSEVRRALRVGGQVIVYEDNPESWWDRFVCSLHDRQWRERTGPCTFNTEAGWRKLFEAVGFEVINSRALSRGRNLAHPVSHRIFLLGLTVCDHENRPNE
jgi:SAM-dependent methyltransferase